MAGPGKPGPAPGTRPSGRRKGTPNKSVADVRAKLASLGCDPIEGMAKLALGDVPCQACKGKCRANYKDMQLVPADADGAVEMTCLRCLGDGAEPIPMDLRAKMFAELAGYIEAKRKAVEHSGPDGQAMQHEHKHHIELSKLTDEELEAAEILGAGAEGN